MNSYDKLVRSLAPGGWVEHAKCADLQGDDTPEDFSWVESGPKEDARFEKLIDTYCIECPVMFQCGEDASQEDIKWTLRGGMIPQKSTGMGRGRPKKGGILLRDGKCRNGHLINSEKDLYKHKRKSGPSFECLQCYSDRIRVKPEDSTRYHMKVGGLCYKKIHVLSDEDLDAKTCIACRSISRKNRRSRAKIVNRVV